MTRPPTSWLPTAPVAPALGLFFVVLAGVATAGQEAAASEPASTDASPFPVISIAIGVGISLGLIGSLYDLVSNARRDPVEGIPDITVRDDRLMIRTGMQIILARLLFSPLFTGGGTFVVLVAFVEPGLPVIMRVLLAPFGLVFFLIGAFVATYNQSVVIDRAARTGVRRISALWIPVSRKRYRLDGALAVRVYRSSQSQSTRRYVHSGGSDHRTFNLAIQFREGADLHFETVYDYTAARRSAEYVANFLRLPTRDETEPVVRILSDGESERPEGAVTDRRD